MVSFCPAGGTGIRAGLRNRLLRVRISGGAPRILQYRTGHRARSNAVGSLTNWMWLFVVTSLSFPGGALVRVLTRGRAKPAGKGGRHFVLNCSTSGEIARLSTLTDGFDPRAVLQCSNLLSPWRSASSALEYDSRGRRFKSCRGRQFSSVIFTTRRMS